MWCAKEGYVGKNVCLPGMECEGKPNMVMCKPRSMCANDFGWEKGLMYCQSGMACAFQAGMEGNLICMQGAACQKHPKQWKKAIRKYGFKHVVSCHFGDLCANDFGYKVGLLNCFPMMECAKDGLVGKAMCMEGMMCDNPRSLARMAKKLGRKNMRMCKPKMACADSFHNYG